MSKASEKVTISEEKISTTAGVLISLFGESSWHRMQETSDLCRHKLISCVATLEAENAELKEELEKLREANVTLILDHEIATKELEELRAYRDGYDPKERLPETEDYYLTELELNDGDIHIIPLYFSHGEFNKSCGIVIRWYPLPPAGKEGE